MQACVAAKTCYDLTYGGYSDCYLPAMNELGILYDNRVAIGGFTVNLYWSSTDEGGNGAENRRFLNGDIGGSSKDEAYDVRCVRKDP